MLLQILFGKLSSPGKISQMDGEENIVNHSIFSSGR